MSMKLKVASSDGRWRRNIIPIRENGEWRMENGTALPFSILHSSIIKYAQTATPIIGEAFFILHSPFFIQWIRSDYHTHYRRSILHSPFSILQSMNTLRLLNPTLAKHSPLAPRPSLTSSYPDTNHESRKTQPGKYRLKSKRTSNCVLLRHSAYCLRRFVSNRCTCGGRYTSSVKTSRVLCRGKWCVLSLTCELV